MMSPLQKLPELLESDDIALRIAAVRVITEIGLSSKEVIRGLGRCLQEPDDELRLVALKGLARLGAKDVSPMVVPLILSAGPLREQAMAVISKVGPSVIPQLKLLYPQADFHGKRAVITALSRIGGKHALAYLLSILPEEPFEIQKHLTLYICEALDRMSPALQAPIYSLVLRMVRKKGVERQPQILITGAILLGHFKGGMRAVKARAQLRALVEKKYPPEVRRHAMFSFNRLVGQAKLSTAEEQFLWKAVCNDDWHNMAQHALAGFQRLHIPKNALTKTIDLLHKSPHFSVHIHIFERLQNSDRVEVAEAILPFLADARFRVREAAESALRRMPTSIESLFGLLMKTDDLEITQRINAILRDFPQKTRQKYVERASSRLLALFEENDPHYRSFLDFVKSLDPEPLRKRVYQKAQKLKRGKTGDKWERMTSLLQLLWDNHLITAEGRYLLATGLVRASKKDVAPASRRANLGLRVLRALIYDDYKTLARRLINDKDLTAEDYFYLGFHFAEEGEDMRPFSTLMLERVVGKYPRSKVAGPATHKLQLQAKAMEVARKVAEAEAEVARKKQLRRQRRAEREARLVNPRAGGAPAASPAAAAAAAGTKGVRKVAKTAKSSSRVTIRVKKSGPRAAAKTAAKSAAKPATKKRATSGKSAGARGAGGRKK